MLLNQKLKWCFLQTVLFTVYKLITWYMYMHSHWLLSLMTLLAWLLNSYMIERTQQIMHVRLEGHSSSGYYTQLDIQTCTAQIVHKLYCNVSMMLWSPSSGKKSTEMTPGSSIYTLQTSRWVTQLAQQQTCRVTINVRNIELGTTNHVYSNIMSSFTIYNYGVMMDSVWDSVIVLIRTLTNTVL